MIKVYSGLKGNLIFLFFIAGAVLFLSMFFWGMAKAIQLFLPLMTVLSDALIIVFVAGILPATFFKDLRPALDRYAVLIAHILGFAAWMMVIALVAGVVKPTWAIAGDLALWISFNYGMRSYSQWVLNSNLPKQKKGNIIDVEVVKE